MTNTLRIIGHLYISIYIIAQLEWPERLEQPVAIMCTLVGQPAMGQHHSDGGKASWPTSQGPSPWLDQPHQNRKAGQTLPVHEFVSWASCLLNKGHNIYPTNGRDSYNSQLINKFLHPLPLVNPSAKNHYIMFLLAMLYKIHSRSKMAKFMFQGTV